MTSDPRETDAVAWLDRAPIALWMHDLSVAWDLFQDLRREGVDDLGAWLDASPDHPPRLWAGLRRGRPNQATLDLYGAASIDELVQRSAETLGDDAHAGTRRFLVDWFDGAPRFSSVVGGRRLDGRPIVLRLVANAPRDRDEASALPVALIDITEQEALRESIADDHAHIERLLGDAQIGRWAFDRETSRIRVTAPISDLLGIEPGTWTDASAIRHRLDPDVADGLVSSYRAHATGELFAVTVPAPGRPRRWFEVRGRRRRFRAADGATAAGIASEITRYVDAAMAAQAATGAFALAAAPLLVLDDAGVVVEVNDALLAMVGRTRDAVVGADLQGLSAAIRGGAPAPPEAIDAFQATLRGTGRWTGTVRVPSPDGSTESRGVVARRLAVGPGQSPLYLCTTRDADLAMDWQERAARLAELVHVDPLTGLANRAALFEHLQSRLATGAPVAVLFGDLDGFKPINDTHGHDVGDAALREIADRLDGLVRDDDFVARIGGDEFVVVVSSPTAANDARRIAERAILRLAVPLDAVDTAPRSVTASFGLALAPDDADGADALLRRADRAMYRAKAAGGSTWRPWDCASAGVDCDDPASFPRPAG